MFLSILKDLKKIISHRIFKKIFDVGKLKFLAKTNLEKAKHPRISPSFDGNMQEAQI